MSRILACGINDLTVGEARRLPLTPPISLFRTESGYFAIADTCTHGQASLADGFVEGDTVECPLHMAQFCLRRGTALTPPANRPVATYAVVIEGEDIYVEVVAA